MNYVIKHEPLFDTAKIEKHYTEKDGVDVKYVCTSAVGYQSFAADIFYRETPHPEFGNHYFGLYLNQFANDAQIMITNADKIEDFEFGMIKDEEGSYHYSAHRHDYKCINGKVIDGGRAYIRSGDHDVKVFKIKDGEFYVHAG